MKSIALIFLLLITTTSFGQDVNVLVKNFYVELTDKNEYMSSILCETKQLEIDSIKRIRLLYAEGKDDNHNFYKVDDFDYFDYDDMVIKSTFPITFISKKKLEKLSEIKGKLRYFTPTIANRAIKIIENPQSNYNTDIFKNENSIKVILLNIDNLIALKKNKRVYKKEIDTIILENNINEKLFKKCIDQIFSDHKQFNWNSKQYFAFYIEDPNELLVSVKTYNSKNKIVDKVGGTNRYGISKLVVRNYFSNIQPDWKLIIEIETPESIKDFDFKLENILFPEKK